VKSVLRNEERLRLRLLQQLKDKLLDSDIAVDDIRRELDYAAARLRTAVAARDATARRLEQLIDALRRGVA
jgi:hypothetical protein